MSEIIWIPHGENYSFNEYKIEVENGEEAVVWELVPQEPNGHVVAYLHGNAENLSTHLRSMLWLVENGVTLYGLDYRGYGNASGVASIDSSREDIKVFISWLVSHVKRNATKHIIAQSLGASLLLVSDIPDEILNSFNVVVLDSAFSSFREIARDVLLNSIGYIGLPLALIVDDSVSPIDGLEKFTNSQVVFIHAKDDEIVPFYHSENLFERFKALCKEVARCEREPVFFMGKYGGHISLSRDIYLQRKILELFKFGSPHS